MTTALAAAHSAIAYGCRWASEFPLQLFQQVPFAETEAEVQVALCSAPAQSRPFHFANNRLRFAKDGLRYLADDGTVLDLYDDNRIEVTSASRNAVGLPPAFYGTMTAALLASRGYLPLHGSAVAVGDRAVVLCGHSGAGKSTLTAALISSGAKLISDDLSGLRVSPAGTDPVLFAGRRAIRLFPDVADLLGAQVSQEVLTLEGEKKVLALPPAAEPAMAYTLAAIMVLDTDPVLLGSPEAASLVLLEHGYRRRAFRHLPGHARRVEMSRRAAGSVPVLPFPRVEARDAASLRRVADATLHQCKAYLA